MTATPAPTAASSARIPARSAGLKLLLVCGLALLMSIPALLVFGVLDGRTQRAREVAAEIGGRVGGPQTFLGPVIAVPYVKPAPPPQPVPPGTVAPPPPQPEAGVFVIFPETGQATVNTRIEARSRSLFNVPIYQSDVGFRAAFDLRQPPTLQGATLDWNNAELLIGASDTRGALSDIIVDAAGRRMSLTPAATVSDLQLSAPTDQPGTVSGGGERALRFSGAPAGAFAQPGAAFTVASQMRFSGAQRVAVLPFAKTTQVSLQGDSTRSNVTIDPSFDGGPLPTSRNVDAGRFDATWSMPFVARGVPGSGDYSAIARLGPGAMGVSLIEPANPYQAVERSLKYALMFVGLVFLTFFVFETTTSRRVHPAQYILIGLAQIIFYLLLLAIAEQLGFDIGFLIAALATVSLISAYAWVVFDSRRQGIRAAVIFSLLYAGIYVLMRLEELALLVGSVAAFLAIAAVMWFTRRIDWYGMTEATPRPRVEQPPMRSTGAAPPTQPNIAPSV